MREDYSNSDTTSSPKDKEFENILRPKSFKDFYGQEQIISNIKVFVKAAKKRSEPLDHVILHGPPGLGKTTLSHIISNELSTNLNRGLFNPDIWNVHVSTHVKSDAGTQKITEDSEFEIVSTEEEQVSIEQEKIVFQTCEKIMPMNKELASTECSSSNDFAVGDTLIVKGQVVLEDRSPGAIPKMVTVAIPYPKAMILIENGNFITSTAAPQLLTQKHTLTNNIVKIIPGSDGSFITSFDLRNGVYQSGLYLSLIHI